ncbi:MAG TPA: hypothetical protein PKY81_03550 [bacterium]|nr:hypothetical protein [bacterium]HPN30011.1 hypothetical protein [bacterium]
MNVIEFSNERIFVYSKNFDAVSAGYKLTENNEIEITDAILLKELKKYSKNIILIVSPEDISSLFLKLPSQKNMLIDDIIKAHISKNTVFKLNEIVYTYKLIERFDSKSFGVAITFITCGAYEKYLKFIKKNNLKVKCMISPLYIFEELISGEGDALLIFIENDYSQFGLARKKQIYYSRNSRINNLIFDIQGDNTDIFNPLYDEIKNTIISSEYKIEEINEIRIISKHSGAERLKEFLKSNFESADVAIADNSVEKILKYKNKFYCELSLCEPKSNYLLPYYIRKRAFTAAVLAVLFAAMLVFYSAKEIIRLRIENSEIEKKIQSLKAEAAGIEFEIERIKKKELLMKEIKLKQSGVISIDAILNSLAAVKPDKIKIETVEISNRKLSVHILMADAAKIKEFIEKLEKTGKLKDLRFAGDLSSAGEKLSNVEISAEIL